MGRACGVAVAVCCMLLTGCVDSRIQRASSVLNIKTQVAAKEFAAAATADAKVEVARRYFDNAPALTQVLDDYLFGRQPEVAVSGDTPYPVSGSVPDKTPTRADP